MAEFENETFVEEGGEGYIILSRGWELHVVIAAQCIIGVVGIIGNILALYHYIRRGERRTYIIGTITLAAKDLMNCSIVLPKTIILETRLYFMSNDFLCKMSHLVGSTSFITSLFLLMILAVERCACICHNPRHSKHWKAAVVVVIAILIVALGLGLVPALGAGIWYKSSINQGNENSTNSTLEITSAVKNESSQLRKFNLCTMNDLMISRETIFKFSDFETFLIIFSGAVTLVAYVIAFAVVYRRHRPTPNTIRFQNQGNTGVDIDAGDRLVEENSEEITVDIINSEWKELEEEKSTQRTFVLMFFVWSVVFWVTNLPAILITRDHIRFVYSLFFMHQIPYGLNPLIYFAIDIDFHKEVKGLFRSTWSRLRQ